MRSMQLLSGAVLATRLATTEAAAQGAPDRLVRVSHDAACCESPLTGTLLDATPDSIHLRPDGPKSSGGVIALSRRSVQRFERRERVGANTLAGTLVGLFFGPLAGYALGTATMCHHCDGNGGLQQLAGLVVGGIVGPIVGATIGASIPHYEWKQGEVPRAVGISPGAQDDASDHVPLAD